mgnify:CR=1
MSHHERLATYVEQISDDFQSTFKVVDQDTLANMMGLPGDFEQLRKIVSNYLPDTQLRFVKTNQLPGDYDIYLMVAEPNSPTPEAAE